MGGLRLEDIEADGPILRAPDADAVADTLPGVLRRSDLSSVLARSCSIWASRVRTKMPANSAQLFEVLMSTTRTASMRALGGSTPKIRGASPFSTHRQNFFSAVRSRC